jgi:hypothetical protein
MGVPVSTSDWIDAWAKAGGIQIDGPERESLIALFSLHHNWVARQRPPVLIAPDGSIPEDISDDTAKEADGRERGSLERNREMLTRMGDSPDARLRELDDTAYGHGV